MPSADLHLLQLCLIFACLLAGIVRCQKKLEATSVDITENDWFTFDCNWDSNIDKNKMNELGVTVQECSEAFPQVIDPTKFTLVAAVFGRLTGAYGEMKEKFMKDQTPPVYYANTENAYVKDGLVEIVSGSESAITIKVKANLRTSRICAICAQTAESYGYTETKKVALKIRNPPTVGLSLNDEPVPASERRDVQMNQTVRIVCTAEGPDVLTVKLLKNDKVLESITGGSLTHVIAKATREHSGVYKCEASTDMQFLVDKGASIARTEFMMAVKFAPQFDVSEVVRYTKLGSQETIKISVSAYPAAELTCDPKHESDLNKRESYDDQEFVATYQLVLSNLNSVHNQTVFECVARNEVGQRQLRITLTAKAPTPEVMSDGQTSWHNSYQLKWRHDEKANIDFYQVEIDYKVNGVVVNTTKQMFEPKTQRGSMALVDGKQLQGQTVHSGVLFGLNENSEHNIRLQSCNQHGCSEFSKQINVRTPAKMEGSYNDPENPEKRKDTDLTGKSSSMPLPSSIVALAVSIFCSRLLQHQ